MLAGSKGTIGPGSVAAFAAPWGIPRLRARFAEIGLELPQQIGATFLGDVAYLRQLTAGTPGLDDDHPRRLEPVLARPSLSDPRYGSDPAVTRLYETVLGPTRARQLFATSPFIQRLWPKELLDATLPFFDQQRILNRVFWDGGRPLRQIDDLHALLTKTPLRTLPLWILGSDAVKERIAQNASDRTGSVEYARALSALAARDYVSAAALFRAAEQQGLDAEPVRALSVYALCLTGRIDAARQAAEAVQATDPDARYFWEWMGKTFGVGQLKWQVSDRRS
jgi:hypothetical protein